MVVGNFGCGVKDGMGISQFPVTGRGGGKVRGLTPADGAGILSLHVAVRR